MRANKIMYLMVYIIIVMFFASSIINNVPSQSFPTNILSNFTNANSPIKNSPIGTKNIYINTTGIWTNYTNNEDFIAYTLSGNTPDSWGSSENMLTLNDTSTSGTKHFILTRELNYTCTISSQYYNYSLSFSVYHESAGSGGSTKWVIRYYYGDGSSIEVYNKTTILNLVENNITNGGFNESKPLARIQIDIWNTKIISNSITGFQLYDECYKENRPIMDFTNLYNSSTNVTWTNTNKTEIRYTNIGDFNNWTITDGSFLAFINTTSYLYMHSYSYWFTTQSGTATRNMKNISTTDMVYSFRMYTYCRVQNLGGIGYAQCRLRLNFNDSTYQDIFTNYVHGGPDTIVVTNATYVGKITQNKFLSNTEWWLYTSTQGWYGVHDVEVTMYDEFYKINQLSKINLTQTTGYYESKEINFLGSYTFNNYTMDNITYTPGQSVTLSLSFRNESASWTSFTVYPSNSIGIYAKYMRFRVNMTATPYSSSNSPVFNYFLLGYTRNASLYPDFIAVNQTPDRNYVDYHDSVVVSASIDSLYPLELNENITYVQLNYTTNNWATSGTILTMKDNLEAYYYIYEATIPAKSFGTLVKYCIHAAGWNGTAFYNSTSSVYNYTVTDLTPPVINTSNTTSGSEVPFIVGVTNPTPYPEMASFLYYSYFSIYDEIEGQVGMLNISVSYNTRATWSSGSHQLIIGYYYRCVIGSDAFSLEAEHIFVDNNGFFYWNITAHDSRDNYANTTIYTNQLDTFAPNVTNMYYNPDPPQYYIYTDVFIEVYEANTIQYLRLNYTEDNWITQHSLIDFSFVSGNTWKATIPRYNYNTLINFEIYTKDTFTWTQIPPHTYYNFTDNKKTIFGNYTIGDNIPPAIAFLNTNPTDLTKVPSGSLFFIYIVIDEPTEASGIKDVYISWRHIWEDTDHINLMVKSGSLYSFFFITTPLIDDMIIFKITMIDNAGNIGTFGPLYFKSTRIGALINWSGMISWIIWYAILLTILSLVLMKKIINTKEKTIGAFAGIGGLAVFLAIFLSPINTYGLAIDEWWSALLSQIDGAIFFIIVALFATITATLIWRLRPGVKRTGIQITFR